MAPSTSYYSLAYRTYVHGSMGYMGYMIHEWNEPNNRKNGIESRMVVVVVVAQGNTRQHKAAQGAHTAKGNQRQRLTMHSSYNLYNKTE